MIVVSAKKAKEKLSQLLKAAADGHEPIHITGTKVNGVLLSEEDWRSIQETLHLISIPGMRDSIRKGLKTPVARCSERLEW